MKSDRHTVRGQLLRGLDEAFGGSGWHGPTLKGALRGLGPDGAAWRPAPGRHNVWELAVHAAYWKHIVIGRITGAQQEPFGLPGTNWFARPDSGSAAEWREDLARLTRIHARLVAIVETLPDPALTARNAGSRETVDLTVRGIAAHDLYHAGQIQLLKRMWQARAKRPRA
jgi:DinB family protein